MKGLKGLFGWLRRRQLVVEFFRNNVRLQVLKRKAKYPTKPPKWLIRGIEYEYTLEFARRGGIGKQTRFEVFAELRYLELPQILQLLRDVTGFLTGAMERELEALTTQTQRDVRNSGGHYVTA